MDSIWPILQHPFTWGLGLGILVVLFVLKGAWSANANAKREIKRLNAEVAQLQQHINTHLKITASGNDRMEKELADLKTQNENLRVNLSAAQQKPGRAEVRQLHTYELAIARMREQAPGFAQAWEQALRQANTDQDAAESGFAKLVRKVLPGSSSPAIAAPESKSGDTDASRPGEG